MLHWALVFLIVAIIAGVLGFRGIAAEAAGILHLQSCRPSGGRDPQVIRQFVHPAHACEAAL